MIEPNSPTWLAVKAWADGQIAMHTRYCKQPGLPMADTEGHRSAIAELETLLKLGQPSKIPLDSAV